MWRYQHAELAAAALDPDEERELSEAIAVKQHARALQEAASLARAALEEGECPARQSLGAALAALKPFTDKSPRLAGAEELLQTAADQAAEAASELERFLDGFQVDPRGLDELHERKALYEELRRKYHRDVHGLLALHDDLAARLDREGRADDELEQLAGRVEEARSALEAACAALHERRCDGAPRAAAEAQALIRPLALDRLELTFQVEPDHEDGGPVSVAGRTCRVSGHGADRVRLLARTNPGEAPGEVGTIASGGERSRIHLGLTVLRQRGLRPLLRLFDEVDAGLGMDAATPVALLLGRLATDAQAICITHLPTVAVHGHAHWRVDKLVNDGRTRVVLHHLGPEERVQEVARQLGGEGWREGDSAAQLTYARQLLHTVAARSVTGSGGHEDS
jgi:DNA repair protein RecN (Recombination protein N)